MRNALKTTALFMVLTLLFIGLGDLLGGIDGMLVAFALACVLNLGAYWFSGDVALRMVGARTVTPDQAPELYQVVQELSVSAGLPLPRVAIIDDPSPNAFATGRDPRHAVVAVTTGILDILDRHELKGVLAHELSHVRSRDILIASVAATLAWAITLLARGAMFLGGPVATRSRRGGGSAGALAALLMLVLAPLAAMLIQLAISRGREYAADAEGAQLEGDAEPLARALEKLEAGARLMPLAANPVTAHLFIVNPLRPSAIASLFSTHPPTAERIRRLREIELRSLSWAPRMG
jgi:heat shock protein HtpX